jgi:formylmethanofuran dehydrogenase subunit C
MTGLTLRYRGADGQRLDLAGITPSALAAHGAAALARRPVGEGRHAALLGDAFELRDGPDGSIVIEGATDRLDGVGTGLTAGRILVDGSVGDYAARAMTGGTLEIRGSAGAWLASRMSGGTVRVAGSAGDFAGGAVPGDGEGMNGGLLVIGGHAGARAGDRMRRGLIAVAGSCGGRAGSRMRGGTVVTRGGFGPEPGPLMRRGTLVGPSVASLLPTFVDCGDHELVMLRVLSRYLVAQAGESFALPSARARRLQGDMATIGRGEILLTLDAAAF